MISEELIGPGSPGSRPAHATALLPAIERAAGRAGGWGAVDAIAVGTGPGSFTGLRIGIATSRALAAALAKPAVGVGTLDALALGISRESDGRRDLILAALDARRGQLFAGLYDAAGSPRREPFLADPAELSDFVSGLSTPPLAAGSGALRFRHELSAGGAEIPGDSDPVHRIAARDLCALGAAAAGTGAEPPEPRYLRPPDAERWRERDTSQRTGD